MLKDHYSDLTCAHLHQSKDSESNLEVKNAFEACARNHESGVKYCHADDGRFSETYFIAHAESKKSNYFVLNKQLPP